MLSRTVYIWWWLVLGEDYGLRPVVNPIIGSKADENSRVIYKEVQ